MHRLKHGLGDGLTFDKGAENLRPEFILAAQSQEGLLGKADLAQNAGKVFLGKLARCVFEAGIVGDHVGERLVG